MQVRRYTGPGSNQARPTCSRCSELGETCRYGLVRRKPGPLRGSRHTRACRNQGQARTSDSPIGEGVISGGEYTPTWSKRDSHGTSPLTGPSPGIGDSSSQFAGSQSAGHQRALPLSSLASYFDNLQDANPIFSKEGFFNRYQNSLCAEDLISTIVIITANLLEDDLIGATPSIDHFRKAYLLAFYEFHQFPGHHAWLRVGRITRMAYRIGLDRLDRVRALYSDWGAVSSEDMQEWRWIWWCIYRLDCYTNLSSGMPYLIDDACISTSLIESNTLPVPDMILLLTKILLFVPSHPDTLLRNVHTITTATLRQVGKVVRVHLVRSPQATIAEAANVEKLLATIRTALPPGWLNTRRNAFANESYNDYHARMVTILHLRMAQLLLAIVDCGQRCGADEWLAGWERIIEPCQDMASIAEHWNSAFCLAVDPAVSYTLFTALIFLDLHKKTMTTRTTSATTNEPISSIIDHHITILRLQLEHFAQIWTLPRLLKRKLISSQNITELGLYSFHQSVSGPLTHGHIALILSHFEAPLHPRWLRFLSTAHTVLAVS
ncbi:hypothetical protein BDW60DRAFT_224444 [Aspergillus nidulans var. acristatus]